MAKPVKEAFLSELGEHPNEISPSDLRLIFAGPAKSAHMNLTLYPA